MRQKQAVYLGYFCSNYDRLPTEKQTDVVCEWMSVFTSDAMYLLLSQLTGLSLHPLANQHQDDEDAANHDREDDEQPAEKKLKSNGQSSKGMLCYLGSIQKLWRYNFPATMDGQNASYISVQFKFS